MVDEKPYKCVNCGDEARALYRSYGRGPSVLKLTKCGMCNGVVDKYVEYDPVIVMIDLVLVSREAQRHVIYNTDFKQYWKLLIVLTMLETYGAWKDDSLLTVLLNNMCHAASTNSTQFGFTLNAEDWAERCSWWRSSKEEETEVFIWEKDFYIQFITTSTGVAVFVMTTYILMDAIQRVKSQSHVPIESFLKAFSLANMSILFTLPMLVWGNAETAQETRALHYVLVFIYSSVVMLNVYSVVYKCSKLLTTPVLLFSNYMKFMAIFNITPYVREYVS